LRVARYINIAPKLASELPPATRDFKSYLPHIDRDNIPRLEFRPITFENIESMLREMLSKTSSSHDGISNKKLKAISKVILFPLSHLINISMKSGHVPDSWKVAKIIPLFKNGDPTQTTNYRPISLLCTFSKVLEKAVYRQTYKYLNSNNLIANIHFGFRSGHSCQHLLIKLQEAIFNAKNNKQHACAVFIDLKKHLTQWILAFFSKN
jgi:hypothetical protein